MTDTQKDFEALTWAIDRLEHLALARAHDATDRNDAKRFAERAAAAIETLRAALFAEPATKWVMHDTLEKIRARHDAWNIASECNDATRQCHIDRATLIALLDAERADKAEIQPITLPTNKRKANARRRVRRMKIPKHIQKRLPKAILLKIEFSRKWYFERFRCANFVRYQIGCLCIIHRAPWLERSARALYPHLFKDAVL